MKSGGHFAAMEQPDIFIKDLHLFNRTILVNQAVT